MKQEAMANVVTVSYKMARPAPKLSLEGVVRRECALFFLSLVHCSLLPFFRQSTWSWLVNR